MFRGITHDSTTPRPMQKKRYAVLNSNAGTYCICSSSFCTVFISRCIQSLPVHNPAVASSPASPPALFPAASPVNTNACAVSFSRASCVDFQVASVYDDPTQFFLVPRRSRLAVAPAVSVFLPYSVRNCGWPEKAG